jgi:hypothetical protein
VWTYNSARVYVGKYTIGHIADMPQDDTYREINCSYKVIEGNVVTKPLISVKVKGATDSLNNPPYPKAFNILKTIVIYPKYDSAIVEISGRNGSHKIKLVKHIEGKSNIFKVRL